MKIDTPTLNGQISEEAAEWFVEFRTGALDAQDRQRFDNWIRTSPEHLRAYLEFAGIWAEGHRIGADGKIDHDTLMQRAAEEGNVVALSTLAAPLPDQSRRHSIGKLRLGIAAGLAVVCVAAGSAYFLNRAPAYITEVGEQRSVTLEDGTTVAMNALSRIKVHFTQTQREVTLLEGQALFQVAKDAKRPFTVRSGQSSIRAVGTEFDVYRRTDATVVTVLEGRVAVSGALPKPMLLSAGEQASVVKTGQVEKHAQANLRAATAWTQRQLIFEAATLREIAQEFNRYSARPFFVEPSAPNDLKLSGVFSTNDLNFLVRFLRERPGVAVRETQDRIIIGRTQ